MTIWLAFVAQMLKTDLMTLHKQGASDKNVWHEFDAGCRGWFFNFLEAIKICVKQRDAMWAREIEIEYPLLKNIEHLKAISLKRKY